MPKFKIKILAGKHTEKEFREDGSYVIHNYSASPKDPREGNVFISNHNLAAMFNRPPGNIKFELLGVIPDEEPQPHRSHPPKQVESSHKAGDPHKAEVGLKEDPTKQPSSSQSQAPKSPSDRGK